MPEAREDYPSRSAARPARTPCDALTAQGCLLSKECVLEAPDRKTGGRYVCRAAVAPCEGGVAQADPGFAQDCVSRGASAQPPHPGGGCTVRPAQCFCPNAATKVAPAPRSPEALLTMVACACGEGPTQQCLRGK